MAPNIYNGLRHYRVRISKPIASFLRFNKFQIFVKHNSQVPTCRKCNCPGHFSNVCPNRVCFNCEGLGHEARNCPCPVLCCICKEEGHLGINCTYSWFCSTVSPTEEQDDVAVESDDDDGLSDCSYGRGGDYLLPASPLISETPSPLMCLLTIFLLLLMLFYLTLATRLCFLLPILWFLILMASQTLFNLCPIRCDIEFLLFFLTLSTVSRRSSSPVTAKSTPSVPSEPVPDPPSSSPDSLDNGMDVTVDLKRKWRTRLRSAQRKGRKNLLISEFSYHA